MPVRYNIRALTLDLDDTLWPSLPTLQRAEARTHAWLAQHAPPVAEKWSIEQLRALRLAIYNIHPELHHDFLRIRRLAMHDAFSQAGLTGTEADALMEQSLAVFMAARQEVDLYPDVLAALQRLSRRYPLASLTNGNADVARIGLGSFFKATISAHDHGASKPAPALFHIACGALDCAPQEVMHIGDDMDLDVRGARGAGLHAMWINRTGAVWSGDDVPHNVTTLVELETWLAMHAA